MLSLLAVLASQVPEAVALAAEFDAAQLRAAQLEALERITLAITSNLSQHAHLNVIIKYALHLLDGQSGGIYEYYPEREELVVTAAQDRPDYIGKVLKVGEGMAGRLVLDAAGAESEPWDNTIFRLDDGTPFRIIDDYNEWPGRAPIYAIGRPFEAVIEVPLKWQDKVIGVLYVDDHKGRRFMSDDAQLLKRFADHAAIAMTNASLLAKDQAKLRKLERLSEAMKKMMSNLGGMTLEERLYQMAQYAVEILQAEVCGVFLVKEPGILTLEASYGHREGGFKKGRKLPIRKGDGTGLTGHIAAEGKLFNQNGEALTKHPAVRGVEPDCTPTSACTSLLAIPLTSRASGEKELLGLIRVSNKTDEQGRALPTLRFVEEDEWVLTIFADAVVTVIEGANLVNELSEHKD
jgi:GAF domain-containing protein